MVVPNHLFELCLSGVRRVPRLVVVNAELRDHNASCSNGILVLIPKIWVWTTHFRNAFGKIYSRDQVS